MMKMKSEEYKRGYDAGYKQALLDALRSREELPRALVEPGRSFKLRSVDY